MIMAVMVEEGTPMRWTAGAVRTLETIVQSRVQRVLALGSTLSRCANKATLLILILRLRDLLYPSLCQMALHRLERHIPSGRIDY